jgi:hypothetical protein
MNGLDLGNILIVLVILAVAVVAGVLWMKRKWGPADPASVRGELEKVAAGDIHRIDDAYKLSPLYPAAKALQAQLEQTLERIKHGLDKDPVPVAATPSYYIPPAAAPGAVPEPAPVPSDADPEIARLQAELEARRAQVEAEREAAQQAAMDAAATQAQGGSLPVPQDDEGLDAYAMRIGADPDQVQAIRVLASLHPGWSWNTAADRVLHPEKYYTEADRDTATAVTAKGRLMATDTVEPVFTKRFPVETLTAQDRAYLAVMHNIFRTPTKLQIHHIVSGDPARVRDAINQAFDSAEAQAAGYSAATFYQDYVASGKYKSPIRDEVERLIALGKANGNDLRRYQAH